MLEEQIARCESDIAKIDAVLAGLDNPATDAEIRPDGEIEAFNENQIKQNYHRRNRNVSPVVDLLSPARPTSMSGMSRHATYAKK